VQSKLIKDRAGERTFASGEEAMAGLREFARETNLAGAHFTAIGAFSDAVLGFFDLDAKDYMRIPVPEQVEVLSLLGNVARHQGRPQVHAHVVVGKRDGTAHGGHLLEAHVRPTLEVIVEESPRHLERRTDAATGLPLLKAD
jgi:uncharacterized protein